MLCNVILCLADWDAADENVHVVETLLSDSPAWFGVFCLLFYYDHVLLVFPSSNSFVTPSFPRGLS